MTAHAAPLEKAVEEAREILSGAHSNCAPCLATGLHTLLAALDADPSRKCDCGKPRLPGPCSGSCDNDE